MAFKRFLLMKKYGGASNSVIINSFEDSIESNSNIISPFIIKKPYQFRPLKLPLSQMKELLSLKEIDSDSTNTYIKLKIASSLLIRSDKNVIVCVVTAKDDDLAFITFSNLERTFDREYVSKLLAKGNNIIIISPSSVYGSNEELHVSDPNDIIHDEVLPVSNAEIYEMKKKLQSLSASSSPASSSSSSSSSSSTPSPTSSSSSSSAKKRSFCCSNGCRAKGSFLCPKCNKLGITSSFCSQACFKANYENHKSIHKK